MESSHYETLQVVPGASAEAIRGAYDALMAQTRLYPDHPATPARVIALQTAFAVLSDPGLRAAYDAQRSTGSSRPIGSGRIPTRAEMEAANVQKLHEATEHAFVAEQWAGFWRRLGAAFIDSVILWIPGMLVLLFLIGFATAIHSTHPLGFGLTGYFAVFITYHGFLNASEAMGTFGRRAVGAAVVSAETGERIALGQSFLRAVVAAVSITLLVPELIQLFSSRRRSPSDLVAGTVVVRKEGGGGSGVGLLVAVGVLFGGIVVIGILAAIAMPAYQDYTTRAHWAEALQDARALSVLVEQRYQSSGSIETSPEVLGYHSRAVSPFYTLQISQRGFVSAKGRMPANAATPGVVGWMPSASDSGTIHWTCMTQGVADRYLPAECRGSVLPSP